MRPLWMLDGHVLCWQRSGSGCGELGAGGEVFARLRWAFPGCAIAEAADGEWTFSTQGFKTRMRLRYGLEADVATLVTVSRHEAKLEFCDGQVY